MRETQSPGLYERLHGWIYCLLALTLFTLILLLPLPAVSGVGSEMISLPPEGQISLAIVALCLALWISEALPFAVTGLIVFFLFSALGVDSSAEVIGSGLGHPLVLFFLSLTLISVAFVEVGLGHRVSLWVLTLSKGRASRLILLTLSVGAVLAMCVTALAATSVLLGMAREILGQSGLSSRRTNFGRALLIATGWGPLIGSVGTPLGAGSNLLTIAYLKELAGINVTFLDWMALGVPLVLLLIPAAWLILRLAFPIEQETLVLSAELASLESENQAALSRREWSFLVIFATMLILWVAGPAIGQLSGGHLILSLQTVGLGAALFLFLPGLDLLKWSDAERMIHWGTLLVVAGGLAAGVMLYRSQAARWLAWALLGPLGMVAQAPRIFGILGVICLLRFIFSSSTAAAAILVPLIITLAQDWGADVWMFSAPAAFAVNLAFIVPTQAGVSLISYSAGQFSSRDMSKGGIWLTLIGILVTGSVALILGKLLGLY